MKKAASLLCIKVLGFLRITIILTIIFLSAISLSGCEEEDVEQVVRELDYTIVTDSDLPDALSAIIDEKKTGDMMLTYATESELYIVKGFGTRATDGYSIQVTACYQTEASIFFETELNGPSGESTGLPTYPYIVIKMEYIDLPVSFQ